MMKDIHWQSLSRFESYDFVARWYQKAHQRKPNAAKVSQINACFIQGREYFSNAASSAMSVKPLLLYYGALSLSRGVILANNPRKKEESLKKKPRVGARRLAGYFDGRYPGRVGVADTRYRWNIL